MYKVNLKFKNVDYLIKIIIKDLEGYNLDIRTKEPLCGDDFQGLKKYLEDEGYITAARKLEGYES
jgi:hypothetical protein